MENIKFNKLSCLALMCGSILMSTNAFSSSTSFQLRESITVPSGYLNIGAIMDMDGDSNLDVVIGPSSGEDEWLILEQDGSNWVQRFNYFNSGHRVWTVGDVDGDGLPEIATGLSGGNLVIHESTGDNTYGIIHSSSGYSSFIDGVGVGDSDGDSNLEFLIAREGFPSRVSILEGTGNNSYTNRGFVSGTGGNNRLVGTLDLDGDTQSDLVFSDDSYQSNGGRTYVYENGTLVYENTNFSASLLGDTNGDGVMEMIGRQDVSIPSTVIYENTGDNTYSQVFSSSVNYGLLDLGKDNSTELFQIGTGTGGFQNQVRFYSRNGGNLFETAFTGSLLDTFSGDIERIMSIADTNNDGFNELAVRQGNLIHILEVVENSTVPEPTAILLFGFGLAGFIGTRKKSTKLSGKYA